VLVLDSEATCVLEVVQGKADGFIYDKFRPMRIGGATRKRRARSSNRSMRNRGRPGCGRATRIARQVNRFLQEYKARGGFEKLGDRYLAGQKEAFRKLGYPFYF